jgi:hypothetical protein
MKKGIILALVVGLLVGVAAWLSSRPDNVAIPTANNTTNSTAKSEVSNSTATDSGSTTASKTESTSAQASNQNATNTKTLEDEEEYLEEVKPATEVYANATEALEAVKNGAQRYDDLVLEQFVGLKDCAWCPEFFDGVKELMLAQSSDNDLKSYSAEILALSGSVDNVNSLFDALDKAEEGDAGNLYAEAIELAYGDDQLVTYLNDKLSSDNKTVKEAALAAMTNHDSPSAIDAMYKATTASNDPDGFYSQGLGLGEMIPSEESLTPLTDIAKKNDQYSHLAIKSLLNYGVDGLKIVQTVVSDLDDASVSKLLENAVDHVSFDGDVKQMAQTGSQSAKTDSEKKFWAAVLEEIKLGEEDELAEDE